MEGPGGNHLFVPFPSSLPILLAIGLCLFDGRGVSVLGPHRERAAVQGTVGVPEGVSSSALDSGICVGKKSLGTNRICYVVLASDTTREASRQVGPPARPGTSGSPDPAPAPVRRRLQLTAGPAPGRIINASGDRSMNPAKLWATRKISGLGRMQRKADALVELANLVLELVKIVSFKRVSWGNGPEYGLLPDNFVAVILGACSADVKLLDKAAANVDLLFDEDSKFTWGGRGINWTSQDPKEG